MRLYQIGPHQKGCEYFDVRDIAHVCDAGIVLESSVWLELEEALSSRGV